MLGRSKKRAGATKTPVVLAPGRRHGRRPIRSSLTGAHLGNPDTRVLRFELAARGAIEVLKTHLAEELSGVRIGYTTAPKVAEESERPLLYTIDRVDHSIVLHRMPIQRASGLHVDDAEHRRMFIEHCVYLAVCEYLGREPWEVMPGRFDHF